MSHQKTKRRTFEEKRAWVLALLNERDTLSRRCHSPPQRPSVCAIDEDDQQAWQTEFGGKVVIYTLGPKVSPDFARTLRRMWIAGDLLRATGGNQDARSYGQKTWYVTYYLKNWRP